MNLIKPRQAVVSAVVMVMMMIGSVARAGGALGNGKRFQSNDGGFDVMYPKQWSRIELAQTAVLVGDLSEMDEHPTSLSFHWDTMEQIKGVKELEQHLIKVQPQANWQGVSLAGRQGFVNEAQGVVNVQLLQSSGRVFSISYRNTDKDVATIQEIVSELRFLKTTY